MSKDALYVEKWLMNEWGDIILLFDKFQKQTAWTTERCNTAFHEVFYKSQKVTW